jgi:hypothetical protein
MSLLEVETALDDHKRWIKGPNAGIMEPSIRMAGMKHGKRAATAASEDAAEQEEEEQAAVGGAEEGGEGEEQQQQAAMQEDSEPEEEEAPQEQVEPQDDDSESNGSEYFDEFEAAIGMEVEVKKGATWYQATVKALRTNKDELPEALIRYKKQVFVPRYADEWCVALQCACALV